MSLKLLQINTVISFNASGRIAEDIGQMAISKGWESSIAYGRNSRPSESSLIKIGNKLDILLHGLQNRLFDRHGFGSRHATNVLIRKIKDLKPDIIHLHNIHGYYINIRLLFDFLAIADIPVVWTLHDCWPLTGHCAYFDFAQCDKWKTGCFSCPQKNQYPVSLWLDNSKRNFRDKKKLFNSVKNLTLVPVSNWLSNLVSDSFLKNNPLQTIYNGVNLNVFIPQENNKSIKANLGIGDRLMLLGVSSIWESRKGLNDFCKLSTMIEDKAVIVLVGLNDEQLKDLPISIIGISRTENTTQLAELYSAADLFLNLTYEDNFPTTNLESLACGTPVLTYKTGGSIESVTDETGFIVEKGDLSSVLKAICIVEKKEKSIFVKTCRERAEKYYNKNDRYNEYFALYEELIYKKNPIK